MHSKTERLNVSLEKKKEKKRERKKNPQNSSVLISRYRKCLAFQRVENKDEDK